jgi:hypothetical protein
MGLAACGSPPGVPTDERGCPMLFQPATPSTKQMARISKERFG